MQVTSKMQVDWLKYSYYLVQGRPFEVKEMFLEDILRTTGYTNKEMLKYKITSSSKIYMSDTYNSKSTKQVTSLCRSSGV